jgi:hypothetical protein
LIVKETFASRVASGQPFHCQFYSKKRQPASHFRVYVELITFERVPTLAASPQRSQVVQRQPFPTLNYNGDPLFMFDRASQCFDAPPATPLGWTNIYQHDAILTVIYDACQRLDHHNTLGWQEITLKDRVLNRIAISAHGAINAPPTSRIRDVVTDDIAIAHQNDLH